HTRGGLSRRPVPARGGRRDRPPGQALQAASERTFERRIDERKTAPLLDDRPGSKPCFERPTVVGEAVLAELRDLHPGMGGDGSAPGGEAFPRARRVAESTQPAEQTGSVDEDPFLRPRRVETGRGDGLGRRRRRAAEVGAVARHPPPVLLAVVGRRGGRRRWRIDRCGEGGNEAVERLGKAPLAREGARETRKIATGRRSPD